MVKVTWHKTASPLQKDGSVVFTRLHQCALQWGHIGTTWQTQLNLCFLWPTWVHTNQTANQLVQPFLHSSRQCCWHARDVLSLNNCPFAWGIWAQSNACFLGPTQVHNPNSISISSAVFAWLTSVTDRPTDRPRYSVGNSRHIYVCSMGDAV